MTQERFDQREQEVSGDQINIVKNDHISIGRVDAQFSGLGKVLGWIVILSVVAGILAVGLPPILRWYNENYEDIDLSSDAGLSVVHILKVNKVQVIHLERYRPRSFLRFRLDLENPSEVGDCVSPSKVEVVPVLVTGSGPQQSVRSGETIEINTNKISGSISLEMTLHSPDVECSTRLLISGAVLHNN